MSRISFIIGVVLGWLGSKLFTDFINIAHPIEGDNTQSQNQIALQQQLTTYQAQLQNKSKDLNALQEQLQTAQAEIENLRKQLATTQTKAKSSAPVEVPQIDNLQRIEGIGPKIAHILNNSGIFSFTQLAQAETEHLKTILAKAGSRYKVANPETWPEQAQLAANGDWTALKALQDTLSAGRRKTKN